MSLLQRLTHSILATALLVLLAGAAKAGLVPPDPLSDPKIWERVTELYVGLLQDRAPGLIANLDLARSEAPPVCDARRKPVTHAILVGSDDIGNAHFRKLKGPVNDIELIAAQLINRGALAERIHKLIGKDANRQKIVETFRQVLSAAGCQDRVIVHFSSPSVPAAGLTQNLLENPDGVVDPADQQDFFLKDTVERALKRLSKDRLRRPSAVSVREAALRRAIDDDVAILLNDDREAYHEVILARHVSDFMIAVRNRGAHAIAVLDILNAGLAAIEARQREAGDNSSWVFEYKDNQQDLPQGLLPGHGDFAAMYAAGPDELTVELPLPQGGENPKVYGLFSFTVATALLENAAATPRKVAEIVQRDYAKSGRDRSHPRIETSSPDLILVAEIQPPRNNPIKILNPQQNRGAAAMKKAELTIEGLVDVASPVMGVMVDGVQAKLDGKGGFSQAVKLTTGLNRIELVAVTAEPNMYSQTLELVFEGDKAALEGQGRRFAIVVANQNYGETTGMPSLTTPFADADALSTVLTGKYGFETELPLPSGDKMPLILKDATKRDILLALHQVGKVAGVKDTVLIFYAGHGVFEQVTSIAYWVPSDAEQGFEPSYLSAADISAAIQRIQAGHLILISDSCYSGALLRGGPAKSETIEESQRVQALLKLQSRRSRIVITSGNNEPVADIGGEGHSVFARALLTGLEKMDHDAFSARELFDDYIIQQVSANADQEPQYRPLEKVGHEGGDFVFVRAPDKAIAATP